MRGGCELVISHWSLVIDSCPFSHGVIHIRITMKTATVRDLRNHFADVAKWIECGEPVAITRNGIVFATLAPAKPEKRKKVDWATRLKERPPLGSGISKEATEKLWSDLRD